MTTPKEMGLVYGALSAKSNRLATRFGIVQEAVRRCSESEPCNRHACPRCLESILGDLRHWVQEWCVVTKGLDLRCITLRVPFAVLSKDVDSIVGKLRLAVTKLLRGKKPWPQPLCGWVGRISAEVFSPSPGSESRRFLFSILLIVDCGDVAQVRLASRWKNLLGAVGIPRRAPRSDLVEIAEVGPSREKALLWLVPPSESLLRCMPTSPFSASAYLTLLPRVCRVLMRPRLRRRPMSAARVLLGRVRRLP